MEDGAALQVEVQPRFEPVGREGPSLMRTDVPRPESMSGATAEFQIRPGEAWVITCASRADRAPPPRATSVSAIPAQDIGESRPSGRGSGPDADGDGPSTQLPLTLGEWLLSGEQPPIRTLLVFIARLPAIPAGVGDDPPIPPPMVTPEPDAETGNVPSEPTGPPSDAS
jgi:hypothetical protein